LRYYWNLSVTSVEFSSECKVILTMTFQPLPQPKMVLDLATTEGCKAELTQLAGYVPWRYNCQKTVAHLSTNRVRRRVTSFMRRTTLTTTPCRQRVRVNVFISWPTFTVLSPPLCWGRITCRISLQTTLSEVTYARYTRVFHSRQCCNLYTELGDSVNDYGGKEEIRC